MKTNIPLIELNQILQNKLYPETIVVSLNEMEEKYSSKPKHWNSKRIYPFWKVCLTCQKPFQTFTKEQATRNKTCSIECKGQKISKEKTGKTIPLSKRKLTLQNCSVCGKDFMRQTCHINRGKVTVCSNQCNGVLRGQEWKKYAHLGSKAITEEGRKQKSIKMKGSLNPAWKGGVTYFSSHGNYPSVKYVRCPQEFTEMSRKDGYVAEHRLILAQHLGRCLTKTEVVHHINHNPKDNRLENLMLFKNNQEHKLYEARGEPKPIWQI